MEAVIKECKANMEKCLKAFEGDLAKVRTGRASVALLDSVRVDYYGTLTPLNQVGTISTPDARTIVILPFEKKQIQSIEKAIMIADLGVQPNNDGNVVRIPIPALTEERRKDIAKNLRKLAEDSKVGIRHVRRDINEHIKKLEKDKALAEDDSRKLQTEIQKITDDYSAKVDERLTKKEKEVMTI